jgi:sigma-B regulation protein RsbU (phosphoserine phosphatase)
MWPFDEFLDFMKNATHTGDDGAAMDELIAYDRVIQGREEFVDDCSLVEFSFL